MNLLLLAGVLIALLVAYGLYLYLPIHQAIKETKPLMAAAVAYEQHPENPAMRILVIGDSTAVGTGGRPEESIAGRLGQMYPGADITNDSKNGRKLDAFLAQLRTHQGEQYDLILFQIGANDITAFTSLGEIRRLLDESLTEAEGMAPRILVMSAGNVGLAPVFRFPLSTLLTERARSVRALYMEVIELHPWASYIDLFNEREDEPFNRDIDRYYAVDHFHPSGDGYGIWFKKVTAVLTP